jgi:uncharacterized protein YbaR (Trm112 family)
MAGDRAQDAGSVQRGGGVIRAELLALLACPVCDERSPLRQEGEYLICTKEGIGFPIEDGIPRLLPESAIPAEQMKEKLG